jgi:membrane protease YdiL (CAAX protease family)
VTALLAILEPLAVFGMIVDYIWSLHFTHPWSWAAILALVLASHFVRRERAATLGFCTGNFRICLRKYGPALALFVAVALGASLVFGTLRPIGWRRAGLLLGAYIPWGLFQQYMLNGYFLKRLESGLSQRISTSVAAGLFAAVHMPNLVLMAITLAGGYLSAAVYRQHKNLYFLGLAHAVLGLTVFLAMPDFLIHHLYVGPGWFAH